MQTVLMQDAARLRALVSAYGRLRGRHGGTITAQVRGALFNELIADVLDRIHE
jgi:hypothetical protein